MPMHTNNNDNVVPSRAYPAAHSQLSSVHINTPTDAMPQTFVLIGVAIFGVCLCAMLVDVARLVYVNNKRKGIEE